MITILYTFRYKQCFQTCATKSTITNRLDSIRYSNFFYIAAIPKCHFTNIFKFTWKIDSCYFIPPGWITKWTISYAANNFIIYSVWHCDFTVISNITSNFYCIIVQNIIFKIFVSFCFIRFLVRSKMNSIYFSSRNNIFPIIIASYKVHIF